MHRDVKPGNLLVRAERHAGAHRLRHRPRRGRGQLTAAGSVLGTASYISPEQATGGRPRPPVRRLRARRGRLPVPGRAPPVRGGQPARDRDEARPGGAAAAAAATSRRRCGRSSSGRWRRTRGAAGRPRPRLPAVRPAGRAGRWPAARRRRGSRRRRAGARRRPSARARYPPQPGRAAARLPRRVAPRRAGAADPRSAAPVTRAAPAPVSHRRRGRHARRSPCPPWPPSPVRRGWTATGRSAGVVPLRRPTRAIARTCCWRLIAGGSPPVSDDRRQRCEPAAADDPVRTRTAGLGSRRQAGGRGYRSKDEGR